MIFTDTHTHLYATEFDADRKELMQQAIDAGVSRFFLPNVEKSSVNEMLELCKQFPENCFPMMGLHPCSVKEDYLAELALVESELSKGKYFGVGEIGLDFYWDKSFIKEQEEAFLKQITWSCELNLPVSIHSRSATTRAIELIQLSGLSVKGVFHCFSGSIEEAKAITDMGMYLGIGGVVTYKNSGLDAIVSQVGLKHIVLETDAPYLPPVPHRGKRNIPEYLLLTAQKLAVIKNCSVAEVAEQTTNNSKVIFKQ
ncbi:MAG TPA: TatD family hydrolase [Bacteroidia bacterium]|nr:TatD family hydrolase [Bacteroidia bacterium]OQB59379.1 MAG: putative deoxyribonuclease YcfH [Bacteroidetes bacterium ADurb.Bin141]QQR95945.1 MAG: TatD family hydrolase [Bacteroidota bacterium]MBP7715513.1 TatD family hydrolase [Bacteroidia bacterium]MBP8667605.1 TatD family hydrolase [Bacteroidia bacterium]